MKANSAISFCLRGGTLCSLQVLSIGIVRMSAALVIENAIADGKETVLCSRSPDPFAS